MDEREMYAARKRKARLAGASYLVVAFAALPDMLRRSLFAMGDAAATARNLLGSEALFRWSVAGDIVTELAFLATALCLYGLLEEVGRGVARSMLALVGLGAGMAILNAGTELAALGAFLAGDQAQGMLLLRLYQALAIPAGFFFGLWMLPLGYLVFKSAFMPKALGVLLMLGSSGYVAKAFLRILAPGASSKIIILSVIPEVAAILWLLVFGVSRPREERPSPSY